jgi:hypothetical protein
MSLSDDHLMDQRAFLGTLCLLAEPVAEAAN